MIEALKNPTIFLGNLRIDEPITTLTDVLLAIIGLWAFFKTAGKPQPRHITLYRWFFLVTAISTFVSSLIGHAFSYHFGMGARIYGWMIGIVSVAFAQFAAISHAQPTLKPSTVRLLNILMVVEIVAAIVGTAIVNHFIVVEIHSALGLLVVMTTLEVRMYQRSKSVLSRHLVMGVGFCILAVTVHLAKIAISRWFNHLDLSHVFMCISLYVMYLGVKKEQQPFNT